MSIVKPEYGPTLPTLLAPLPRRAQIALAGMVVVAALAGASLLLSSGSGETALTVSEPVTFNLAYADDLRETDEDGSLLSLERSREGLFLDSYVVRELTLPRYRGSAAGVLPLYAFDYIARLSERYEGFALHGEGRTRINNGVGYQVVFRARRGERTIYGRHLLLVEEEPLGLRRGVVLELTSTPSATENVDTVGSTAALQTPLRSFRFGTERSGGES